MYKRFDDEAPILFCRLAANVYQMRVFQDDGLVNSSTLFRFICEMYIYIYLNLIYITTSYILIIYIYLIYIFTF